MTHLVAITIGVTAGAYIQARIHAHRAEEAAWDETKARAFAEAGDRLFDDLFDAGRLLADKDRLVAWLTGAVHEQATRLRRQPHLPPKRHIPAGTRVGS